MRLTIALVAGALAAALLGWPGLVFALAIAAAVVPVFVRERAVKRRHDDALRDMRMERSQRARERVDALTVKRVGR